jgi:hypothetical protein
MFRACLLEPLQCPVPLAEAFINDSEVLWWNVPSLRQKLHLLQHLMPLGSGARDAQRVPQIHQLQYAAMRFRITLLQYSDGFPPAPGLQVHRRNNVASGEIGTSGTIFDFVITADGREIFWIITNAGRVISGRAVRLDDSRN